MALTERIEIDQIEVVRDFFVQVRQATIINAAWTPEVRQAYETFKAEQANRLGVA